MKRILFLYLLTLSFLGQSQSLYEIKLSKTVSEDCMGVWTNGDYKVYVQLSFMETCFRNSCKGYLNAALTYNFIDSSALTFYNHTAKRYQEAAEEIGNAQNGFNFRNLILYHGIDNEMENVGNSYIVESFIKQFVENGTAVVFYKGEPFFYSIKDMNQKVKKY